MSLLRKGWGAYAWDKNTSVRVCAKNAGGAYVQGGAYLRDTMVNKYKKIRIKINKKTIYWADFLLNAYK